MCIAIALRFVTEPESAASPLEEMVGNPSSESRGPSLTLCCARKDGAPICTRRPQSPVRPDLMRFDTGARLVYLKGLGASRHFRQSADPIVTYGKRVCRTARNLGIHPWDRPSGGYDATTGHRHQPADQDGVFLVGLPWCWPDMTGMVPQPCGPAGCRSGTDGANWALRPR